MIDEEEVLNLDDISQYKKIFIRINNVLLKMAERDKVIYNILENHQKLISNLEQEVNILKEKMNGNS